VPPAVHTDLQPFLDGGPAARVHAYPAEPVIAEKVETLITKFPAIGHRLKDLLEVVMLANERAFEGATTVASLRATFDRRRSKPDVAVLDEMLSELTSQKWRTDWAAMRKEKAVVPSLELTDAVQQFDRFVRPLLEALREGDTPVSWPAGGPWSAHPPPP